jgi:anti-anti-sigma factor
MALTVFQRSYDGVPALELVGRVTDDDARELSHEMRALCKKGHATIVVDISRVQFIDSHGLGVFVFYSSLMEKAERKLAFLNTNRTPTSYVNRLFEMTNLDKVFLLAGSMRDVPK